MPDQCPRTERRATTRSADSMRKANLILLLVAAIPSYLFSQSKAAPGAEPTAVIHNRRKSDLPFVSQSSSHRRRKFHCTCERHQGLDGPANAPEKTRGAALRWHDFPPRDSGVYDSGRRSVGEWRGGYWI